MNRRRLTPLPYVPEELRSKTPSHVAPSLAIVIVGTIVFAIVDHHPSRTVCTSSSW